jgi:Ca-activated chloride channel homolog
MKSVSARLQPFAVVAAVAALCGPSVVARQQPDQQPPTFKSGARTVAVYATVSDAQGRLVPDLGRDDFEIYEDGKLRPLTLFASENQPITIVVMLDRSGSMKTNFSFVQVAAEQFVRRLMPGDKARIGSFAQKIQLDPEEFTNNQDQLIRILRSELQPQGPTPLWNAVNVAMTALGSEQGRRVVLVFTDGADNPGNLKTNNLTLMDVMERGQKEDVMVYAIGLESRMPPMAGGGMSRGGFGTGGFGGGNPMGVQQPDPGLPTIAAETGGGYFELRGADNLASTFLRVAEELHRQYALGFEPAKLDGKTHKLEVKVKKSGTKVRARKHYVAAKEK